MADPQPYGAEYWKDIIVSTWDEIRPIVDAMIEALNVDKRAPLTEQPDWATLEAMDPHVRVAFLQNLMQVPNYSKAAAELTHKLATQTAEQLAPIGG